MDRQHHTATGKPKARMRCREARTAAAHLNAQPETRPDGRKWAAYRCPTCGCWHIGHENPNRRAA